MFRSVTRVLFTSILLAACTLPSAHSQCLDWHTFPRVGPELGGTINALVVHDDGSGPALYVGGDLVLPASATPTTHVGLVRWDGASFSTIAGFPGGRVNALLSFDDGSGPGLYVAEYGPSTLLKWQGSTWQVLGMMDQGISPSGLTGLAVHDDGSGPAVYVSGDFTMVSGVPAARVAKWNGSTWSALGSGPTGGSPSSIYVGHMTSFDDGSGPALFVVGRFPGVPQAGSPNISKWQGGTWSGVGTGTNNSISDLVAWNDGHGPALFVVGQFTSPGYHVARWDGTTWGPVGGGINPLPNSAAILDVGTGPRLYVSESGISIGSPGSIESWDGTTWSLLPADPLGGIVSCGTSTYRVSGMIVFDEGAGPRLIAATTPGSLGNVQSILSRYTGSGWERLGARLQGLNGSLRALAVHDDGSGPALYAGSFSGLCTADESLVANVTRWDGETWSAVGNNLPNAVTALTSYSAQSGSFLLAASRNATALSKAALYRWGGFYWQLEGTSTQDNDAYLALQQFGPYLYVGGSFWHYETQSTNIERWSFSTGLTAIGPTLTSNVNGEVNALTTFDDGTGLALYAGGTFTLAGTTAANRIARWNGTNWSTVGTGMDSLVDALATFDDGTGTALYAAGTFTTAGGVPASCIAKWNGTTWSALGAGLNAQVLTLEVFDDGSGRALYAGGNFSASGNVPMEHLAKWNGTNWSAVGGNVDGTVWALKSFDDGTGPGAQLFAGGVFHHAGSLPSENLAAWRGCGTTAITKFCFGDGSDGACPCGNVGLPNRGCNNSAATGGARLNATGTTSPDTIVLHAGGELPNAPTLLFQGSVSLSQPILFGDGMRCVGGNLKRLFTTSAVGGAVNVPDATQVSISARSAMLGDPLVPGSVRSYQTWYRDPNLSFCAPPSGDAWNLSNAVRIVW